MLKRFDKHGYWMGYKPHACHLISLCLYWAHCSLTSPDNKNFSSFSRFTLENLVDMSSAGDEGEPAEECLEKWFYFLLFCSHDVEDWGTSHRCHSEHLGS